MQRVVGVFFVAALAATSGCTPSAEKPLRPIAQKPEMANIPSGWLVQHIVKKVPVAVDSAHANDSSGAATTAATKDTVVTDSMRIPALWMSKYEITQAQYQALMGDNPSQFKGETRPVESVTFDEAQEFCLRLSRQEGKEYTLPSAHVWKYACRAGATTEPVLADAAWYADNSSGHTHTVGLKTPNAFGLYDMLGNVAELVRTKDVENSRSEEYLSVAKGGSWYHAAQYTNSSEVLGIGQLKYGTPRLANTNYIGFRVMCMSGAP